MQYKVRLLWTVLIVNGTLSVMLNEFAKYMCQKGLSTDRSLGHDNTPVLRLAINKMSQVFHNVFIHTCYSNKF